MGSGRRATQEYLDLLVIVRKPAASRTADEALVYEWFQGLYKDQQIAQAQAAVDQYLDWSGLTEQTITLDPIPLDRVAPATARSVPPRRSTVASGRSTRPTTRRCSRSATGTPGLKVNSPRGCQPAVRSRGRRSNSSSSGAGTSRSSRFSKAR